MESPIEMVRRFCAAWSDNMGAAELAAFFTEDAVYHNIPQEPVTGRENIANTIASVLRRGGNRRAVISRSPSAGTVARWSRDSCEAGKLMELRNAER
jgi:limonene-1,2-epoxide hydrolase